MAINKVIYGNDTLIDLTSDTVDSSNLLSGYTAHDRSGAQITGSVVTADVIDNLTSTSTTDALSANQGRVLKNTKLEESVNNVLGAKNLLPMTVSYIKQRNAGGTGTWSGNVYTYNGVTFTLLTDNDNNITGINVNGTNTGSYYCDFYLFGSYNKTSPLFAQSGTYIASMQSYATLLAGYGNTVLLMNNSTLTQATCPNGLSWVFIRVGIGATVSNQTVTPMIRLASYTDSTFEPYAMTNLELTSKKVSTSDIVDNLTTNDATKVLSAKQGKALQDTKINISDIKDNLTSTDTNKPLSAKQGKVLDEKIDGLYTESTDNEPYVIRQGNGDMVDIELVGGSFAWNQLVQNGNFASTNLWRHYQNDWSVANNIVTLTATSTGTGVNIYTYGQSLNIVANHKYLIDFSVLYTANTRGECNLATNDWSFNVVKSHNAVANQWKRNQYIVTNNSSVNDVRFMIYPFKEPSASVGDTVKIKNVNIFDLTQLFGTTIADAIYAMEQATAGSGVAFFRKYFPNDYYAYDAGSIQSVNVASRKVVGKNLLNLKLSKLKASNTSGTWSGNTYTFRNATFAVNTKANGEDVESITISSTASSSVGYLAVSTNTNPSDCVVGGKYIISSDNSDINVSHYNGSDVEGGDTSSLEFVYNPSTIYWNIVIRASSQTISNKIARPMIRDARITDATYAPYKDLISYPFDTTKQLRGIPSIVNNKLVYDGDIWNAKGITRKYGIVDLGTLNWIYQSEYQRFYTQGLQSVIKASANNTKANILIAKYPTIEANNCQSPNDKVCAVSNSKNVFVRDTAYSTYTADQFKTAMNGVYLVYELAIPTTESASPFQNPQRADASGTEEFVDYGVESSTRDVSIPVGHNSTYKSSEVIQPLEDYVDGAIETIPVVSKSANGLCPQLPNETATTKFLRQDGTWAEPSSGGSIAYSTTKTAVGTWIDGRTIYKQTFEETITGNGDLTITVGSEIDFVIDGSAVLVQDYDYQFGQMTIHSYTVNNCDLTEMPTTYSYPTFHCKGTTKTKVGSSSSYKILMNIASYPTDQSASNINSKLYLTVTFVEYAS